jgi:hypothetical protein
VPGLVGIRVVPLYHHLKESRLWHVADMRLKYRLLKAKLVLYAAGMLHGTEVNNKLS